MAEVHATSTGGVGPGPWGMAAAPTTAANLNGSAAEGDPAPGSSDPAPGSIQIMHGYEFLVTKANQKIAQISKREGVNVDELIKLNVQIRRQLPGWQELPITRSTAFYAGTYIALRRADTVRVRVPAHARAYSNRHPPVARTSGAAPSASGGMGRRWPRTRAIHHGTSPASVCKHTSVRVDAR